MSEFFSSEDFSSFLQQAAQSSCDVETLIQHSPGDVTSISNEPWLDPTWLDLITEAGLVTRADVPTTSTDWKQLTEETDFPDDHQLSRSPSSSSSTSSSESEQTLGDFDISFLDAFQFNDLQLGSLESVASVDIDVINNATNATNAEAVDGYDHETHSDSTIHGPTSGTRPRRISQLLKSPGFRQTAEYRMLRDKNNESVKRCREEKRRQRQKEDSELEKLGTENSKLRDEIRRLQHLVQAILAEKYSISN